MAKPSLSSSRVPSLAASLADKLKTAGLIDAKAAAAAEEQKQREAAAAKLAVFEEGRKAGTIAGISAYYVRAAARGETLEEILAWGASWFEEMATAGHGSELERQHILRPAAVHAVMAEDAIEELEGWLGCSVPTSVRRMLTEVGGVDWGTGHTLVAGQMVEQQGQLRELLARFAAPLPELAAYAAAELQLIPLAQLDGNFDFVLRNERGADDTHDAGGANDESPIYFVYHDEAHLYGVARSVEEWLAAKLEVVMERFADRAARA